MRGSALCTCQAFNWPAETHPHYGRQYALLNIPNGTFINFWPNFGYPMAQSWCCDHSPRARHPGMWSQVALCFTMNKVSGGDAIPVEQFQILQNDVIKVLHSICQQVWKTHQQPQDWKRSVFIPIPKKGNAKEFSNYHTIALISHASKECSKFSKPSFNSTWTMNLMFKLGLEKAEEPEIKLPTSTGSLKKQESSRKTFTSALFIMPKPLTV